MRGASISVAAALLSLSSIVALAQECTSAGDGHLGTVHFATTCNPKVAPQLDRAVSLLHSFEFGAAIKGFNEVLAVDSSCAMAGWGVALSRWSNPMSPGIRPVAVMKAGSAAATSAQRMESGASVRERGYVDAVAKLYADYEHVDQHARVVAYERAMADLVARYPADTEATIFHALSLVASASPTDKTYANQLKAGAILETLWAKQPNHPGLAHYIIHSYDAPPLAEKARAAAQRYASIAPCAPHALHMPSHTFTRLGMWQESVAANTQSMAIALRDGSIAEVLHAADYAMYADLQMGQESDAKKLLDELPAISARFDATAVTGAAPGSAGVFALAAIPARWVLERSAWQEAAVLVPHASAFPYAEAMTYFARALGASHTGDLASVKASIDSLAAIEARLRSAGEPYWAGQVSIEQLGARAWLELAEHREGEALAHMREAAAREDSTEKSAVTPGPLAPARELLGDMLVEVGRPDEAREEYRAALAKEPGRRHSLERVKGERD